MSAYVILVGENWQMVNWYAPIDSGRPYLVDRLDQAKLYANLERVMSDIKNVKDSNRFEGQEIRPWKVVLQQR